MTELRIVTSELPFLHSSWVCALKIEVNLIGSAMREETSQL